MLSSLLLIGISVGVEWETQYILEDPDYYYYNPMVTLDNQGKVHIAYIHWDHAVDTGNLNVISNQSGEWISETVASVNYPILWGDLYDIEVDSQGNRYLSYIEYISKFRIYLWLATDTSGEFESERIGTPFPYSQGSQSIELDGNDNPFIAFLQFNYNTFELELRFGWFEQDSFVSERVVLDSVDNESLGNLLLEKDGTPHIIYVGYEHRLYHAFKTDEVWDKERIWYFLPLRPSAVMDTDDFIHVIYRSGDWSIRYAHNREGEWIDEHIIATFRWGYDITCIDIDPDGIPCFVWTHGTSNENRQQTDISYARQLENGWFEETVTETPNVVEIPGEHNFFKIDKAGYAHLVYEYWDREFSKLAYAKSKAPLFVAEQPNEVNPFDLRVRGSTVHFSLPEASLIRLDLYDAVGRRVRLLASGVYNSGQHSIPINSTGLPAGVYFIRLESADRTSSAKSVLSR
ncbi:hypothetical protein CEE36_00860 [candidate division TA06 bacterium B3_TA06]|uniref:Secretion system C-terminal sorting domain-containing protein n=1 Tax=candidate division TA06 bacterium B3_TA06 TaxID=2012487 RepID=A0A532VAZ6_UNCT6|nr:MAG: hypothetical protein CEE36_00860 [candidate division TA06 bacterium B3_TA06]